VGVWGEGLIIIELTIFDIQNQLKIA
jgi:hypothetical protein